MPDNNPYKALMPMAACKLRMCSGTTALSMPTTNLQAKMAMNKASGKQLLGTGLEPTQRDQADDQAENPKGDVLKCLHVAVPV